MAFTLNRRLAQLIDSNGQLLTGKIPNDYISSDHVADNTITSAMLHTSFTVSTSNLTAIDTDDVSEGSSNLYYTDARVGTYISGNRSFGNITTTGYIAGPASMVIDPAGVGDNTGTVVIAGNLQVDGTTTTINSTTMTVDDLNLTLASGAANAAAANGAGITVDGASATITYDGTNDEWDFNKPTHVEVAGSRVAEFGRTGAGTFDLTISDVGVGAAQLWFQAQTNDTGFNFRPKSSSGTNTNALYIAPDGKVGISNTGPAYLIDVGSASSTESNIFRGTVNGDFIFSLAKNATNLFSIRNNNTSIVHLNTQNNATLALGVSSTNNAGTIEHDVRIFSNGTMAMTASTAGSGSSIFSTGAYASGQGDNRTHLGYNTGSGYANYVRGANTVFSGLTQFDAGSTFNSSATFTAGNRPVVINGGAITMKGETGGWAFGLHAIGSSNTNHGGFGFLGGDDAFSYYYIGETYNAGNNFRIHKNGTLQVGNTTILDSNKNITNVGTATFSSTNSSVLTLNPTANNYGGITFQYNGVTKGLSMYNTGFMIFGGESGTDTRLQAGGQYAVSISNSSRNVSIGSTSSHPQKLYVNGNIRSDGAYYVGGLAVIDSSRNFTAGASITIDGDSADPYLHIDGSTNNRDSGVKINAGAGYRTTLRMDLGNNLFIHNNAIHINSSGLTTLANVNNAYNLKVMGGSSNSWFGVYDDSNDSANILVTRSNSVDSFRHLGHTGETTIKATGTGLRIESTNDEALQLVGTGTGLNFTSGSNNRIYFAGKRALEGNSAGTNLQLGEHYSVVAIQAATVVTGNITPNSTDSYDLGSNSHVWRDLYIGDLNLNNETRTNDDGTTGNEVDGTTGNWTIQEGEEHLYIINNKNGKKYKFALEEIQ